MISLPTAAARNAMQFFDCSDDDLIRNVVCDFDFSYLAGQNEMNRSVLCFLIRLQARENFARADFHFRQPSQAENGIGDAAGGHAVSPSDGECDVGGSNHAPRDGFTVKQAPVAGFGLERVAYGVAEIEHAAQAAFLLISGNDFSFQLHALGDQSLKLDRIALQNLRAFLFEAQKKIEIADDATLESLIQAGAKGAGRKRVQDLRVNQNHPWMAISPKQIFTGPEIHRCLTTDGSIHLRQNRSGNLHQFHTAHVEGCQQSGDVADYSAAECDQNRLAVCAKTHQLFSQRFDRRQLLRRVSMRYLHKLRVEPGG